MTRSVDRTECEATFGVSCSQDPAASIVREWDLFLTLGQLVHCIIIRDEQRLNRRLLEPLLTVPGHILDGGE